MNNQKNIKKIYIKILRKEKGVHIKNINIKIKD